MRGDLDSTHEVLAGRFRRAFGARETPPGRIGAELKFPLVDSSGRAVGRGVIEALWRHLIDLGWHPVVDSATGRLAGASTPGEMNDTVASCETGHCKAEFSLAHVPHMHALAEAAARLREELRPFCDRAGVALLGYGIQPVTAPGRGLLARQGRTSVWTRVFPSNRVIPPEDGDDLLLFTVNAASHVHVSAAGEQEAVDAVNVLNGFCGAQVALTADSSVWRGEVDPQYLCVAEKLWDWWMPAGGRVGVPARPFGDIEDYVRKVAAMRPVFVRRDGEPIVLEGYGSFAEYYAAREARGLDTEGRQVAVRPDEADIDLHNTCYWYDARISQYFTIENRANDQQPPDELTAVAALTAGLTAALPEGLEEVRGCDWDVLRRSRAAACRDGLRARVDGLEVSDLARRMLDVAELGLRRRGFGEQGFLACLRRRLSSGRCPAEAARDTFMAGGMGALVSSRRL
jgi:gamma-glutamylcysteine synthetase